MINFAQLCYCIYYENYYNSPTILNLFHIKDKQDYFV